jgi:hypothetical protein
MPYNEEDEYDHYNTFDESEDADNLIGMMSEETEDSLNTQDSLYRAVELLESVIDVYDYSPSELQDIIPEVRNFLRLLRANNKCP